MHIDDKIKLSHGDISLKQGYISVKECCLCFLLVAFCCLACSRSDSYVSEPILEDASVTFSLVLPRFGEPTTYANNLSIAKDLEVENISILVFGANDDSTGLFLYSRTNLEVAADNKFTVDLELTSTAVRVHVFANPPVGSLANAYDGQKEKDVLKSIETDIDLNMSNTLPMHGCLKLSSVVIGNINEEVELLRSVARVDVQVGGDIQSNIFKLHGIAVYFTPNKGCLVSRSTLTGDPNSCVISPTMPSNFNEMENVPHAEVTSNDAHSISNNLFIYENQDYSTIASSTKKNSRIVISGYYKGSGKLSYYPVDFQVTNDDDSKEFIPVLRNHQYILTIISVKDAGYPSEEIAANSDPIDITTSITWDQPTEYIIFEGENYLHIEKRSLILYGDAGISDSLLVGSNINPSEWEMRWGSDGDYQKDGILDGAHFTVEKPIINEDGYLKFTTKNEFALDVKDVLYIRVANRLELTVTVSQDKGILTVDGKVGTINVTAMHYGGLYKFHVLTGDASIDWKASPDAALTGMIDSYDPTGKNDTYLTVNIKPNLDENKRIGIITVSRASGSGVDDVILNITQEQAPYLTIALPSGLVAPTRFSSVPAAVYDYMVTVSDSSRYTWQATSTFSSSDVSLGNALVDVAGKVALGKSGDNLRIYVEGRTSEQIDGSGTVTLELVRKTTKLPISVGLKSKDLKVAAYVTIETGTGSIYVYDRNMGVDVPNANTPAEYFTNADPDKNSEFRGFYYTWDEADGNTESDGTTLICPSGWRLPTKIECDDIANAMKYLDERAYLEGVGGVKCYFPMSGRRGSGSVEGDKMHIHFDSWSSTESGSQVHVLCVDPFISPLSETYLDSKTQGFPVRCVKDV